MSEERNLPKGWEAGILEDLLDYIQPTDFIVSSTEYNDKYKTPVLTAGKSFLLGYTNETFGVFNHLPAIIFDDFTTAIKWVNFPFKVKSSAMKILVPTHQDVNMRYVYYFMDTLRINTDTHKRYWISIGSKITIPIAPIPEQHRIVAKIEELFSSLDKGIESLKTAQEQLKVYRQAVLKWAFEGKLTNKNEKDEKLSKGWIDLRNICIKIGSGATPKGGSENYKASGIPLIRSMNIHFDYIKFEGLAFIDEKQAKELDNVFVHENDVLLNITGASIGRVNIAPKYFQGARVNQHVSIIRPNKNFIPEFIKYFIQSPKIQEWISSENYGVTRQSLTKSMIENLEVPNISLSEQQLIVSEIESRLSVCDKIEESIITSLKQAEALRQSILKKAFEGKLVPQNPNDEPASFLLERIKAEREKNKKVNKVKKKKNKTNK